MGAYAADKPVFEPAPDWVKPAVLDMTPPKGAAGAGVAVLLSDSQVKLTAQGSTTYVEIVATAQAAQGLQALGSIGINWNPDTSRLIVHKLHILRAGKVIDALANGPGFTTLRRETKLEQAALDGTLTAATQLEGLQIGDTLDMAYSIESADPILRGRVQEEFLLNNGPIGHLHARAIWPTSLNVKPKMSDIGPPLDLQIHGDMTEATMALDDAQPFEGPKLAPVRFQRGRELQLSNFATWADVSALLQPLFVEASRIPSGSPLQAEIKKIADQSNDPKVRAQAALTLVQDQVRYVYMGLDGGGLRPASADLTWSRRFGDCKGKTTLLLGLLHALGIEAEPALVSTTAGDGLDGRLPMLGAFDHVLVRATIGGRVYWLDGSRVGDRSLDDIVTPPFLWALPMRPSGASLVSLESQPLSKPETLTTVKLDASAGVTLPAPAHVEVVLRGDQATALNLQLSNLAPADVDKALRNYWSTQYDFIKVTSSDAKYDPKTGEERITMDGTATMDWSSGYEADGASLGFKQDLTRTPGPHADAPFAVVFPSYERRVETIILPNKGSGYSINGQDIDETVGGQTMSRHASIKDGVFTMEVNAKAVAREFPGADGAAVSKRMAELFKMRLFVNQPSTPQDTAALLQSKPTTATGYLDRGNARLNARAYDDALADFEEAAKLDPKSDMAIADRAVAHAWKGDIQSAGADADLALKINPSQSIARHAQGLAAQKQGHWADAIRAYSAALVLSPNDQFALLQRGSSYLRTSNVKMALADAKTYLDASPGDPNAYILQIQIYLRMAQIDLSRADVDRAVAVIDQLAEVKSIDPEAAKTTLQQLREAAERIRTALVGYEKDRAKAAKH